MTGGHVYLTEKSEPGLNFQGTSIVVIVIEFVSIL